jgi:hypothetical protein
MSDMPVPGFISMFFYFVVQTANMQRHYGKEKPTLANASIENGLGAALGSIEVPLQVEKGSSVQTVSISPSFSAHFLNRS